MNVPMRPEANQSDDWRLLIDTMRVAVEGNQYWGERLASLSDDQTGLHLAILIEPYLGYVLAGKKTVESRFAIRRHAPYGRVHRGDVLLLNSSVRAARSWAYAKPRTCGSTTSISPRGGKFGKRFRWRCVPKTLPSGRIAPPLLSPP